MHMHLWQSIPFACIILPLGCAAVTSIMKPRMARIWATSIISLVTVFSAVMTVIYMNGAEPYTFMMGHYPAPWGNEIRVGMLEALTSLVFSLVMLLSLLGGMKKLDEHLPRQNQSLYCVVLLLMTAALMAQVYTNDIFTGYVFLEIMTLAAWALSAVRKRGRTLVAAAKYMIMNLIGSGLFLLGIIFLYDISGHLLMENIGDAVAHIATTGEYRQPLIVVVALITIGLSIKSALFPFHTWVPDAYGYSTPTSQCVLSSLVSKGYIFLLIKIMYRVIGLDVIVSTGITDVLFVFALVGMVFLVLAILWMVLLIFKKVFYKDPNKQEKKAEAPAEAPAPVAAPADDGALVAAITAAVAAYIDSDPALSSQFAGGFRVVSFKKKNGKTSWNR